MKSFLSVLLLCVVVSANASPLTLGEALARVESGHPWFRTRESLSALGRARQESAAIQPPAEISLQLENVMGTGELRAARSAETTLQFSRALDWADRRAGRSEAAVAQGDAERWLWEERRRELLAEAARRFVRVAAAQTKLGLAREHTTLAAQTLATVQTRAEQAAATKADLARARLALTEAELEAEHAEHLLLAARQSLATLWAAESPDFEHVKADFATLPETAAYEILAGRLADTPTQARHAAQIRWHLAQEKLARTSGIRGESSWSVGLRRTEASSDFGFVAGLNYVWPSPPVTAAQTSEARAHRDRTEAESAAALLEARATLFALCQELNHARIEYTAARDEMEPAAQAWLTSIEAGATSGRYGLRDLVEARAAVFEAKCRRLAAAADYHSTLVALEQMLGGAATP